MSSEIGDQGLQRLRAYELKALYLTKPRTPAAVAMSGSSTRHFCFLGKRPRRAGTLLSRSPYEEPLLYVVRPLARIECVRIDDFAPRPRRRWRADPVFFQAGVTVFEAASAAEPYGAGVRRYAPALPKRCNTGADSFPSSFAVGSRRSRRSAQSLLLTSRPTSPVYGGFASSRDHPKRIVEQWVTSLASAPDPTLAAAMKSLTERFRGLAEAAVRRFTMRNDTLFAISWATIASRPSVPARGLRRGSRTN